MVVFLITFVVLFIAYRIIWREDFRDEETNWREAWEQVLVFSISGAFVAAVSFAISNSVIILIIGAIVGAVGGTFLYAFTDGHIPIVARIKWNAIMQKKTPLDEVLREAEVYINNWPDLSANNESYKPPWMKGYKHGMSDLKELLIKLQNVYPEDTRISRLIDRCMPAQRERSANVDKKYKKREATLPACPGCGNKILVGQDIKYLPDGRMVHATMICWRNALK